MTFRFDFALSFAGERRPVAQELERRLEALGYRVFLDERYEHELLGVDGPEALTAIYGGDAQYCVVLVSSDYDESYWTGIEREAMQSRSITDRSNFLLPVMTDTHRPTWLAATRIYFDLTTRNVDELVDVLCRRAGAPGVNRAGRPEIRWVAEPGIGTWKTAPLAIGDGLIVPTAGSRWNDGDSADGVRYLDRATGELAWSCYLDGDANGARIDGDDVFVGTDAGVVAAISVATGAVSWTRDLGAAVVATPLVLDAVVLVCTVGELCVLLDRQTGEVRASGHVRGGVVADPVWSLHGVHVLSRAGDVVQIDPDALVITGGSAGIATLRFERSVAVDYESPYPADGRERCKFHGSPAVHGGQLFAPYVRETYLPGVPVASVELSSMRVAWSCAHDSRDRDRTFGNVRAQPVVIGGSVVVPVAYGADVVRIGANGIVEWSADCGTPFFPQWGSPASWENLVLVPRFDGYVHAIDAATGSRRWSLFLGRPADAGLVVGGAEPLPGARTYERWRNEDASSLNSPLTVVGDEAYVLTSDGRLYALTLA